MNQFFNKLGFASNTTQRASGRGRLPAMLTVAPCMPVSGQKCSADFHDAAGYQCRMCGIDAYLGSFSYINGEQLQRLLSRL